jgi:hypothetical protein
MDSPTATPEAQHAAIAAFLAGLPLRPDAERGRAVLANAFTEYVDDLCPQGDLNAAGRVDQPRNA